MSEILSFLRDNAVMTALGGTFGAIFAWLGIRTQKAPERDQVLNEGTAKLIEHFTAALTRAADASAKAEAQSAALRAEVHELRDEILHLEARIGQLTDVLVRNGITPPAAPPRARSARLKTQAAAQSTPTISEDAT